MSISKFNFNLIVPTDLRKFLSKKMENAKWEFASAFEATLAHYSYNPPMAYNFVHSRNMKIIIKKILQELNYDFILPFLHFNNKNMIKVLEENAYFFDDSLYFFKCADGTREFSNLPVKSSEEIQKIIYTKYQKSNMNFILEKSSKKIAMYDGDLFDLRVYLLVVRIGIKYYTFMYPTIFVNFPKDDKDIKGLLKSLGLGDNEDVSGVLPIMKEIYLLMQKTSIIISNYLEVTSKIYKLEKEMKKGENRDSDFQFNIYGVDLIISADKKPYLSDIALNPTLGLMNLKQKVIREKVKIYDDLINNFIIDYDRTGRISVEKSDFVLLNKTPQDVFYRWVICQKGIYDSDDSMEYNVDGNEFVTNNGESLVQSMMMNNINSLNNDNEELNTKIGIKPILNDSYFSKEQLTIDGIGEEYIVKNFEDLNLEKHDKIMQAKINELMPKKKPEQKKNLMGIATKTIPIIGLLYAAKKTYSHLRK